MSGSNLNSPYGTIYGPDGKFAAALGDPGVRPRRSYSAQVTAKQGTYIIVVGTAEVDRYGLVGDAEYQLTVEGDAPEPPAEVEAPAEPTNEPIAEATPVPVPDFVLSPESAADKGALTLDVVSKDEIHEADEKHSWSFEATAGQSVSIKIRTGGGGLSGSNLNSPYATIYGPDGNFVAALGDPGVRPRRSYNAPLILTSGTLHDRCWYGTSRSLRTGWRCRVSVDSGKRRWLEGADDNFSGRRRLRRRARSQDCRNETSIAGRRRRLRNGWN